MLPRVELNYLLGTVDKAEEFARKGKLRAGYQYLMDRLNDAIDALEVGELWAAELVQRYWQAIGAYLVAHGASPPPDPLGTTPAPPAPVPAAQRPQGTTAAPRPSVQRRAVSGPRPLRRAT
jgi:hypothetical protein